MIYRLTVGGRTYRIDADDETSDILQWYIETKGTPEDLAGLSRQQVVARLGRSALPTDFPASDMTIGDKSRENGFWRGWFESTVRDYEEQVLDTAVEAESAGREQAATSDDGTSPWTPKTRQWTDTPIVAVAEHCPRLLNLNVKNCRKVTDAAIAAVKEHCPSCNVRR